MRKMLFALAILCLLLSGCGADLEPAGRPDPGPVLIGNFVEVNAQEKYAPMEYNDVLAADGIFYATWSVGEAKPHTNEDGEDAEIFDTQVYFLLSEKTSPENARAEVDELLELAKSRYQLESTTGESYGGQEYTVLGYRYDSDTNPYAAGAAAYGVRGNYVVNVEVSALENTGDPMAALEDILQSCRYMD